MNDVQSMSAFGAGGLTAAGLVGLGVYKLDEAHELRHNAKLLDDLGGRLDQLVPNLGPGADPGQVIGDSRYLDFAAPPSAHPRARTTFEHTQMDLTRAMTYGQPGEHAAHHAKNLITNSAENVRTEGRVLATEALRGTKLGAGLAVAGLATLGVTLGSLAFMD